MIKRLIIDKKHIEGLKEIAESSLPLESCALLAGIIVDDTAKVDTVKQIRNVANSRTMFMLDPDEFYAVYKSIKEEGREVVCIFHSHPSNPKPSDMDLKYMMINQIPWLIMSSIDYTFNAYAYYESLERVEVEVID